MSGVAFVLHGHFYQPPRENPWTEVVPREVSASPFHDWNQRITAESYRPNGWARILDEAGRVVAIVDNYEHLSFNVGPTLLSWLETEAPETYERILSADGRTRRAIAQAYGHPILPLCNDRDLRTQIRWGQADFRHRLGREPEGMWLPETAVDDRVLATLAEEGVRFTLLAPSQITAVRPLGSEGPDGWQPVDAASLDTRRAYRWRHPDRPELGVDLVVYDGDISHDVAFGGFPSQVVVDRIVQRAGDGASGADRGGLVAVACDGETFGHHHHFADRGVAYALSVEAGRRGVEVPRLADWLAAHPAGWEAQVRLSAWSCAHGVGRWLEDCGCHTGGEPGWNQAWRGPLRAALDILRDAASEVFERRGRAVLRDPWAARDAYVDVVLGAVKLDEFVGQWVIGDDPTHSQVEALTLLECQRHALLMYTSCGWFFNDLAGIETLQILRYAARCMDLLVELDEPDPLETFLDRLAEASSNRPSEGDGRMLWERRVEPARADGGRVAAHLALVELLATRDGAITELGGYLVEREIEEAVDRGGVAICAERVTLAHRRTRRRTTWAYGAVHLGGLEVFGAVRPASPDPAVDEAAVMELADATRGGERVTTLLRMVVDRFGPREFGLESALPGMGDDLLRSTATGLADRFVAAYDELRTDYHDTLVALAVTGTDLPAELRGPVELALARRLEAELADAEGATDPAAYRAVQAVAREAREEGVQLSSPRAGEALARALEGAADEAASAPTAESVDAAVRMVDLARELGVPVDVGVAQQHIYDALSRPDLDPAARDLLRPLGRALGLAG
jgi:alpha-amylase/alpha-mannosidase (GH57 family)